MSFLREQFWKYLFWGAILKMSYLKNNFEGAILKKLKFFVYRDGS